MNFGTFVEDHNGCKISKISEWEILLTHLNNFWIFQLWTQIKKVSDKFLRFFAKTTKSRVENENMAENRNWK